MRGDIRGDELERLVDGHIELCELLEATRSRARRADRPFLVLMTGGEGSAECLAKLVERAFVVYEGSGLVQDSTMLALKAALTQAIVGEPP